MGYKHVLLELYCGYDYRSDKSTKLPKYCRYGVNHPGFHCFGDDCPFKSFTQCPNELAYVGTFGEVKDEDSFIGFGGDMDSDNSEKERDELLELWGDISKKKIAQAYDEFMNIKRNRKNKSSN